MRRLPDPKTRTAYYPLMGGEDLTTPAIDVNPGLAMFAYNYELDTEGRFRRIQGYERFDGRPSPSEASYWILPFDYGTVEIEVGDAIEGTTSGATADVCAVVVESGDWDDGITGCSGYFVVYNLVGTFSDDEAIKVSGKYGDELYDYGDAVDDGGTDTDSISTNWVDTWLDGTGANVFESQFTIVSEGRYAIRAESNDTPTGSARFVLNMNTLLSPAPGENPLGQEFVITFDARHVGLGDDWVARLADNSSIDDTGTTIVRIENTDVTYESSSHTFTHSVDTKYFGFRESSVANDGGVFFDNLSVKTTQCALVNGEVVHRGASTELLDHTYLLAAIEEARGDIEAVPGSGDILGVWQYNGVVYAFRNNSGGTAAIMYKESTSGWTECELGERLGFDTGSSAFIEGETITEGAVSAVIRRVVVKTGAWGDGDAAGFFIITGRSGGNFSAGAVSGDVAGLANATGAQTENTLQPSGRFEFVNDNLGGHASTYRMYGCDGVSKAFEWDGDYFTPIETGMTTDTPNHIIVHEKHLVLMFPGGSVQHSGIGTPYIWTPLTGASELSLGDEGTGFLALPNGLACFARNSIFILYGTSSSDWELRRHSDESGAIEWTTQKIGAGVFLDDRGLTSLAAVEYYGDFKANILSIKIDPYLSRKLENIQASARVKTKNQYRLFFDDNWGVTLTLKGNKVVGFTRQRYDALPVCACSSETTTGEEEIYFGSDDGYVYQMDMGNTFDGEPIESFVRFHFNNLKLPSHIKRIRRITLQLTAKLDTYLKANVDFNYGEKLGEPEYFEVEPEGGFWDVDDWDDIVWDGIAVASHPLYVDGSGTNFSLNIYHSGEFESPSSRSGVTNSGPHTLQGYVVDYNVRSKQR